MDKSNPIFRRCHIYNGRQEAILIQKQAQGNFQYCKIDRHPSPGIKIEEKCQPSFRRCTLETIKPAYWGLTTILGLAIASPITLAAGLITSTIAVMLSAIALIYFQLYKRGFGHGFMQAIISLIVVFGFSTGSIFVSGFSFWSIWIVTYAGWFIVKNTISPALEQAKLMSNYDIKRQPKSQKKIYSSRL